MKHERQRREQSNGGLRGSEGEIESNSSNGDSRATSVYRLTDAGLVCQTSWLNSKQTIYRRGVGKGKQQVIHNDSSACSLDTNVSLYASSNFPR